MFQIEKKEKTFLTKAVYAFGINKNIYNPFFLIDENCFFYCVGINGVVHWLKEKKQRFLLSDEKSYGIICLGMSNDRRLLALGEKSLNKPFVSIFTNQYKLIKKLSLDVADNESRIMNIAFSAKNKYLYCITNGSTKTLFLCYEWTQEKLIYNKIFPPNLFNEFCEVHQNILNPSYIALISINSINSKNEENVNESIHNEHIQQEKNNSNKTNVDIGESPKETNKEKKENEEEKKTGGSTKKWKQMQRTVFLYLNVDRNLEEIKIKNRKLEKIDNHFTNCCWLNDGVLLLINKDNYLLFYEPRKEKLKIFTKHISTNEIVKIIKCSKGFLLLDYNHIYFYEKSTELSFNLNYTLKFYIPFKYNIIFNNYCLLSTCDKFLYFLDAEGSLKRSNLTKNRILVEEHFKNINSESIKEGNTSNHLEQTNSSLKNEIKEICTKEEESNKENLTNLNKDPRTDTINNNNNNNNTAITNNTTINNTNNESNQNKNDVETVLLEFNNGKINDFDVCTKSPIIVICYDDNSIKMINYKKKEVIMVSSFNNEPLCLSIHCTGHLLLVSFTDKLRLFHILYNKLKIKKEFLLKSCSCCKFSNGGSLLAVSKISTIYIYKTYTYDLLFILKSHVNYITDIIWSSNDFSIFSIGKDGYLFEYSLYNNGSKNIEVMQKEKKFLSIDLEILADKNKNKESGEKKNTDLMKYDNEYKNFSNLNINEIKHIYVSCDDKTIRQYANSKMECVIESEYIINKILLYKNKFLIAAFYNGFFCRLRFYTLPFSGIYLEIPCHILNCVNLKTDVHKELLFSCSRDGSIYIFSIEQKDEEIPFPTFDKYGNTTNAFKKTEEAGIIAHTLKQYSSTKKNEFSNTEVNNENATNVNETKYLEEEGTGTIGTGVGKDPNNATLTIHESNQDSKKKELEENNFHWKNNCLLYDLNNKTDYILREEEKENDEILIDVFYLQKKNKEVLELQKKIINLKNQMELEMKNRESIHKNELKKLKKEKNAEISHLNKINKSLIKEKEKVETICKESMYELEEKHTYFVNQLNSQFYQTNKVNDEKYLQLQQEFDEYKNKSTQDFLNLKNTHHIEIETLSKDREEQIKQKEEEINSLKTQFEILQKEKMEYIKQIEEDVDEEILLITKKYEQQLQELKDSKFHLMGQFKLHEHIENELKEKINIEKENFIKNNITTKRLQENVEILKNDINQLRKNIQQKEKEIETRNKEILNLNKKNEELEKFKIVLTQKIKDLESTVSPKDSEIRIMKNKIEEMTKCFENNHKKTVSLQIEINEYKLKVKSLHDDLLNNNRTIGNYDKILKNIQEHIKECYLHLHDKKLFSSSFLNLYNKFHKVSDIKNYDTKNIFSEYIRQKEHLENMIEIIQDKLEKETEAFRKEKIKMMNENSFLLKEINDLKMDLNFLKSECQEAKLKTSKMKSCSNNDPNNIISAFTFYS